MRSCGLAFFKRLCSHNAAASTAVSPSALFVPGRYGTNVTPTVIPYYDLNELKINMMRDNLKARCMDPELFSLEKLVQSAHHLEWIETELQRASVIKQGLKEQIKSNPDDISSIQKKISDVKTIEKGLTKNKWNIEERYVLKYLSLPNGLHGDTPTGQDQVIIHSGSVEKPTSFPKSHIELCKDDLSFTEHGVYLESELATLELNLLSMGQDSLINSIFELISGSDFTRSAVLEGCHPESDIVTNGGAELAFPIAEMSDFSDVHGAMGTHLVGSASIYPFVGQLVKNVSSNVDALPIKQFTVGRRYKPQNVPCDSLFSTSQSSAIEMFVATNSEEELETELERVVELIKDFYDNLSCHYVISILPASNLEPAQSKRLSIQMATKGGYQEVGSIDVYGNFLSKRLMLLWSDGKGSDSSYKELNIIGGTLIDVTKAIACLVENFQNDNDYSLPDKLVKF